MTERRRPPALWIAAGSLAFAGLLMAAAAWIVGPLTASGRASNVRGPGASLMAIASAQADFRGNDRDGNGIQDYWRDDVAGLYALKPEGADEALRLVELGLAAADAAPTTDIRRYAEGAPKEGYWVRSLRHADEDPGKFDSQRFGATAYPADGSGHRWAYIVSESHAVHRRRWTGPSDTPAVFPADPLKEGWSPLR